MNGGGFLAQGGYGCVFYPEVDCKGKDTNNKKFLSKIVERDYSADNEINIGKILTIKLKSWIENPLQNHFAPVLSSCNIDVSKFTMSEKEQCTLFEKNPYDDFILMKIRYIDNKVLDSFITENSNSSLIMLLFTSSYSHLLKSLQLLEKVKICHLDIKSQNIVYDTEKSLPIIIDFGLSINFDKLNRKELYNNFYIYEPMYYLWPIEVHLINYILHVSTEIDEGGMRSLAKTYTQHNVVLRAFSPSFQKKYQTECYYELSKYIGKDSDAVINRILKYWSTWDNYALSLLYTKLIYYLIRNDAGKIIKNEFVSFFIELCLQNIHPNPKKRLSLDLTLRSFNIFLYNDQVDKESVFEDIIKQIGENKSYVDEIVNADRKYMSMLSRKTRRLND
uniref:Protein kinase domain-containing protein n=1 Tax=viral metagenome TaxID=1070528 RepID=A0A6C0C6X7_9ZZZZ